MQHQFFERLSELGREYDRLAVENEHLRSTLAAYRNSEATKTTLSSYPDSDVEVDSVEPCRQGQSKRQGKAGFRVADKEQEPLPNMLPDIDPGGEPDKIAPPHAPRILLREEVHNAGPGSAPRRLSGDSKHSSRSDHHSDFNDDQQKKPGHIFTADIKDKIKAEILKEGGPQDVSQYYKTDGVFQLIARHPFFDNLTLCVIGAYAIWMAVDADWNTGDSILNTPWVFIIVEQVFCVYFTLELFIRFCAFYRKIDCLKDGWFMFDSALVLMMVAETWVLNAVVAFGSESSSGGSGVGSTALLRLARLMRLTRLLRMARLVRTVPELLIMIKAIAAAARTVGFTLILLFIILYVFGIGFKGLLSGTDAGNELFSSVAFSMHSLLMHATFMDDLTGVMLTILNDSYIAFAAMYVCIILSAITVMNMLIGVLCEVISAVAAAEKEVIQVRYVKETLQEVLSVTDSNMDGCIDSEEFLEMLQNPKAQACLDEIEIDAAMLVDFMDVFFAEDGKKLPFHEFMEELLQLRGSNTATVKDLVDMRKILSNQMKASQAALKQILSSVAPEAPQSPLNKPAMIITCTDVAREQPSVPNPEDVRPPNDVPTDLT